MALKFSFVNGERLSPFPKGKGSCPVCGNDTHAKCGNVKIWHWAHGSNKICDNWWENETAWHRAWKGYWSDSNQEIVHFNELTGEKHIADVKNDDGLIIEMQNSPISQEELISRELFYGNMIWIVNAEKFKKNIYIGAKLPDPDNEVSKDMCIYPMQKASQEFIYYRKSEHEPDVTLVELHGSHRIQSFIDFSHIGHYLFIWAKPRSVWFHSKKSVYFDFGENILWKLVKFNKYSPLCLRAFSKQYVINLYGGKINT